MEIRAQFQDRIDPILIEKTILAFCLLENLKDTGLVFTFKGGTSLLLALERPGRFSIDVDIVVDNSSGLEGATKKILEHGVFSRVEEDKRSSPIPKQHYKFYFPSVITKREATILLDVLYEQNPYPVLNDVPFASDFLRLQGELSKIRCPALECMLGDKLTAFAPNTTGILFGTDKDLEIIKQLYDIGQLFDEISDMTLVAETFFAFAAKELEYRGLSTLSADKVLSDSFEAACLIGMRGFGQSAEFTELKSGIKKLAGYVYSESFTLEKAILCASKAAYLDAMILSGSARISRYNPEIDLGGIWVQNTIYNKLNKVKKSDPEAFYYYYRSLELLG